MHWRFLFCTRFRLFRFSEIPLLLATLTPTFCVWTMTSQVTFPPLLLSPTFSRSDCIRQRLRSLQLLIYGAHSTLCSCSSEGVRCRHKCAHTFTQMSKLIGLALISLGKYVMHDCFHGLELPTLLPVMYTETHEP